MSNVECRLAGRAAVALALVLALGGELRGQVAAERADGMGRPLQRVDPAVGDLDPLSVSQRTVEGNHSTLGLFTTGATLYRSPEDLMQKPIYYRIGQGYRARVDRVDYVVLDREDPGTRRNPNYVTNETPRVDGEFVERIPANAVFELTLPGRASPLDKLDLRDTLPALPDHRVAPVLDHRLDTRVDGRVGGRLDGYVEPESPDTP